LMLSFVIYISYFKLFMPFLSAFTANGRKWRLLKLTLALAKFGYVGSKWFIH